MATKRSERETMLAFRVPRELHTRLAEAATNAGVGLSTELRRRLEASFGDELPTGTDPETQKFLAAAAAVADHLDAFGAPWPENAYGLSAMKSAVGTMLIVIGPRGEPEQNPDKRLIEAFGGDAAPPPETVGRVLAMAELNRLEPKP